MNSRDYFNELTKVFKWLDKSNTGSIPIAQLNDLWYYSGMDGNVLFPKLHEDLHLNTNGSVLLNDLTKYIESKLVYKYTRAELMEALKAFEELNTKKFGIDDLARALEAYSDIKKEDIEQITYKKDKKPLDSEYLADRIMLSK